MSLSLTSSDFPDGGTMAAAGDLPLEDVDYVLDRLEWLRAQHLAERSGP